jgi:hypothetical protein
VDGLPEGAPLTLYFLTTDDSALLTATFQNHTSAKSVSKDTWRQFFDFYRAHPTGFDAYDEDSTLSSLFAGSRALLHTRKPHPRPVSLCHDNNRLVAHLVRRVRGVDERQQGLTKPVLNSFLETFETQQNKTQK